MFLVCTFGASACCYLACGARHRHDKLQLAQLWRRMTQLRVGQLGFDVGVILLLGLLPLPLLPLPLHKFFQHAVELKYHSVPLFLLFDLLIYVSD